VDGKLVDGTYTGKGGSLKLLVTVVACLEPFVLTLTVFGTWVTVDEMELLLPLGVDIE
jgi:hypothetical protein